jgi:nucleotide-binding universal stress UspA family protein
MKAIIGVDLQGSYTSSLDLFTRLRFRRPSIVFVYGADPLVGYPSFALAPFAQFIPDYLNDAKQAGREALEAAVGEACDRGLQAKSKLVVGTPASVLIEEADALGADLIAVGAESKRTFAALYTGSVSRGVVLGAQQSVLIAKGPLKHTGPLTLLLATDHSEYCNRCIDRFLRLAPEGIAHVIVLAATTLGEGEERLVSAGVPGGQIQSWIEEKFASMNEEVVAKLEKAGYSAESVVVRGHPNAVLSKAMKDFSADLLVLGAQGHGFLERLMVGSISLHQVVAEPHPVLLIRA